MNTDMQLRIAALEVRNSSLTRQVRVLSAVVAVGMCSLLLGMSMQDPGAKKVMRQNGEFDTIVARRVFIDEALRVGPGEEKGAVLIHNSMGLPRVDLSMGKDNEVWGWISPLSVGVSTSGHAARLVALPKDSKGAKEKRGSRAYLSIEGPLAPGRTPEFEGAIGRIGDGHTQPRIYLGTDDTDSIVSIHDALGRPRVLLGNQVLTKDGGVKESQPTETLTFWSETGRCVGHFPEH